jgi:hypothetical protein
VLSCIMTLSVPEAEAEDEAGRQADRQTSSSSSGGSGSSGSSGSSGAGAEPDPSTSDSSDSRESRESSEGWDGLRVHSFRFQRSLILSSGACSYQHVSQ